MPPKAVIRPWTQEEDRLLVQAMAQHGNFESWKDIANVVPGRTNKACRKRWLHSLCPTIKKSSWTPEEDRKLVELHRIYPNKWSTIARFIEGRTDDACSKRFREALDPRLKKDVWSPEEDAKLLDAQKRLGCKWKEVGEEMQRGSLACRNRFRLLERRAPIKDVEPAQTPERDPSPVAGPSTALPAVRYVPPDAYSFPAVEQEVHFQDVSTATELSSVRSPPTNAPFQYTSSSLHAALQPTHSQDQFWQSFLQEFQEDSSSLSMFDTNMSAMNQATIAADFAPDLSMVDDFSQPADAVYPSPLSSPENTPFTHSMSLLPFTHSMSLQTVSDPPILGTIPEFPPPQQFSLPSAAGPIRSGKQPASRKRKAGVKETRLSASKPVNAEIKAYACGHPSCWSNDQSASASCFSTSGDLLEHNKQHDNEPYEEKPYRCALCGFDKKWKSINGLQYHLQVSTVHFQDALSSTTDTPADVNQAHLLACGRPGCTKVYKHLSGLHYHWKHGHHQKVPQQLSEVPSSVTSTLRERQKRRGLS